MYKGWYCLRSYPTGMFFNTNTNTHSSIPIPIPILHKKKMSIVLHRERENTKSVELDCKLMKKA
jgi:hypothetical protein